MSLVSSFRRLLPAQKALVVILVVLWLSFLVEGDYLSAVASAFAFTSILLVHLYVHRRDRRRRRWLIIGPLWAVEGVLLASFVALLGANPVVAIGTSVGVVAVQAAVGEVSLRALPPTS